MLTGKTDKDPVTGKILKIHGYFQQVNPLSEKLVQLFYSVGVTREEIDKFIHVPEVRPDGTNLPSQLKLLERERAQQQAQQAIMQSSSSEVASEPMGTEDKDDLAALLNM